MQNLKLEIGEAIRNRRELLGLSQIQLASISSVGLRTLQMVEKGKANASLDILIQIMEPLGLTIKTVLKNLSKTKG